MCKGCYQTSEISKEFDSEFINSSKQKTFSNMPLQSWVGYKNLYGREKLKMKGIEFLSQTLIF